MLDISELLTISSNALLESQRHSLRYKRSLQVNRVITRFMGKKEGSPFVKICKTCFPLVCVILKIVTQVFPSESSYKENTPSPSYAQTSKF